MFKKTFILMMGLVFVLGLSGMALALDNTLTVNQSVGGTNMDSATQADGATATITQVGVTFNSATTTQTGASTIINLLTIEQIGFTGSSATNQAEAIQTGNGNTAKAKQIAGATGTNTILGPSPGIIQNGNGNYLGGADGSAIFYTHVGPSVQSGASNDLRADQQLDDNKIGLKQSSGLGTNSADIDQLDGSNELVIYQNGSGAGSYNTLVSDQLGTDVARVSQSNVNGYINTATIDQDGNNFLVRAAIDGSISIASSAVQNSWSGGDNTIDVTQEGGGNTAGQYQIVKGVGYNKSDIIQYSGGNSLGVYQDAGAVSNDLDVIQYGSGVVEFSQTSTGSLNYLYIRQSLGSSAIVDQTATVGDNTSTINQ